MNPLKGLKGFSRLQVATYSLDLGAAYWLANQGLGKGEHRSAFVCDPAAFRPWFPKNGGNSLFRVEPCGTRRLFHPKIWRVEHQGKVHWLLGSANLSIPECRFSRNFMVAFESAKKSNGELESMWRSIRQGKSSFVVLDMSRESVEVSANSLKKELLPRINAVCRPRGKLIVASSAGISTKLLHEFVLGGWAERVRLFVSREAARNLPRQPQNMSVEAFMPAATATTDLHGKLLFAQGPRESVLYVGSANFTRMAYSGDNVESGVIVRGPSAELATVVARLLAGRWRKAAWGSQSGSEPLDEWAENGQIQRALGLGVRVDPKSALIVIDSASITQSLGAKLLEVELRRTSSQERLALASPRTGWTLPLHADVLDQELVFHIRGKGSHQLHLAALHFEDSQSDVGKLPRSLSDLFQGSSRAIRDLRRVGPLPRFSRKGQAREETDVRFPWREVLPELLKWRGNHRMDSADYARSILRKAEKEPSSTLRAAIIREVVLAVGRQEGEA